MSRTLETTLLSLLPTYPEASSLPPPLVELASSLLAQSRHNASTLKAEEEVARVYACANIACERLKTSLDLPQIQSRPPVQPRIYKRLYTHLDHILPASSVGKSGRVRTPSSKLRESGIFGSGGPRTKERATPSKEAVLAQFRSKADRTPTKSTGKSMVTPAKRKAPADRDVLPPWIRPTVRFMCIQMKQERVGRTVLAGMQSIVTPHGRRSSDEWVHASLTPLLAAVFFVVITKFHHLEKGELDEKTYVKTRQQLVDSMEQARAEVEVDGVAHEDDAWEGWSHVTAKNINDAVAVVVSRGWQDGGWFTGINDMVNFSRNNDAASDDGDDDDERESREKMQGGDSMFQGTWVVTDQKREEYRRWKEGIMKKAAEMKKQQAEDTVDNA